MIKLNNILGRIIRTKPFGQVTWRIIKVTGIKGETIKTVSLTAKGNGQLTLQTAQLPGGSYTYTLIVDDRIIDTKKMILAK